MAIFINKNNYSLILVIFFLFISEIFLLYRENHIIKMDVPGLKGYNVNNFFGRNAEDLLKIRFFNICFMDKGIIAKDQDLGYVNIPNTEGYSIRIYDRPNFIVKKSFDLSLFSHSNLRTEITHFRINNLGNRGHDTSITKPSNVYRIVFLGDSITFGYYVEENDTFVSRIGKECSSFISPQYSIETFNVGVSSLNAHHIFNHLYKRSLLWSPDLVFWNFYVNDILDVAGQEVDILFPVRRLGLLSFLRYTAIGRLIGNFIFSTPIGARLYIDYENPVNRLVEEKWKEVERDLLQAHNLLKERNIPMVVVIFPSAIQFSRSWTIPNYQLRLKKICEKYNILYIDLLPTFKKAGSANKFYYDGDAIHPNARGHAIVASKIVQFLKDNSDLLKHLNINLPFYKNASK